mgnify:CR=1 FL=1
MSIYCPDETLQTLVREFQQSQTSLDHQLERVDALLLAYPEDARLHFMRGSTLAGLGRLIEAHQGLSRAVALAPEFAIARFQLGFFQLTSGEADAALDTWGRLDRLDDGHYLRKFVDGLRCLVRDDIQGAVALLRDGVALNQENPPLNHDMQLLADRLIELAPNPGNAAADPNVSETSLILRQFTRPLSKNGDAP